MATVGVRAKSAVFIGAVMQLIPLCTLQVRDFVHVTDLATGHSAALKKIFKTPDLGTCLFVSLSFPLETGNT